VIRTEIRVPRFARMYLKVIRGLNLINKKTVYSLPAKQTYNEFIYFCGLNSITDFKTKFTGNERAGHP
jgi:hypothetical protein